MTNSYKYLYTIEKTQIKRDLDQTNKLYYIV